MDSAERSLRQALDAAPEDWSIRLLVAERMHARDAAEEAGALVSEAPTPPDSEQRLHQAVGLAGHGALDVARAYVAANPASAYGHQVLGSLLEHAGDARQAAKHYDVARALGSAFAPPQAGTAPAEARGHGHVDGEPEPGPSAMPEAPPPPPPESDPSDPSDPSAANVHEAATSQAETASRRRLGNKTMAILIAVAVHVLIAVIAGILVILPPTEDRPEIVAKVVTPPSADREMKKKTVLEQVKKSVSASAAAAPVAQLMRSSAQAKFSVPDTPKTSSGPLGMGESNLGAGGFGGTGSGLGSGASFFGGSATGNRFAFILDYSGSMKPKQVNLVVREMERSLEALKPGAQFQVLLFAGGAKFAQPGWEAKPGRRSGPGKAPDVTIVDPEGEKYEFESVRRNYAEYDYDGSDSWLPTAPWQTVSGETVQTTMSVLRKKELFPGTDWRWPFKMAMNLKPPPDTIFFMADGSGGAKPKEILSYAKKINPRIQINMFAMETVQGAAEMAQIAKATGGDHKIVLGNGRTIDGKEYFKDREKVEQRVRRGR